MPKLAGGNGGMPEVVTNMQGGQNQFLGHYLLMLTRHRELAWELNLIKNGGSRKGDCYFQALALESVTIGMFTIELGLKLLTSPGVEVKKSHHLDYLFQQLPVEEQESLSAIWTVLRRDVVPDANDDDEELLAFLKRNRNSYVHWRYPGENKGSIDFRKMRTVALSLCMTLLFYNDESRWEQILAYGERVASMEPNDVIELRQQLASVLSDDPNSGYLCEDTVLDAVGFFSLVVWLIYIQA